MNLLIARMWFTDKSTIGTLGINGGIVCYTLEPPVRTDGSKPRCTPNGTYRVKIMWSQRFQRLMPHVLSVPDFEGILIHWGNYPKDTEGCTLVGHGREVDFVGNSKLAFDELFTQLQEAEEQGQENYVTYQTHSPGAPTTTPLATAP